MGLETRPGFDCSQPMTASYPRRKGPKPRLLDQALRERQC